MSERFNAWPHDATKIIEEALREYVGDGDGEDEKVLAAHDREVEAEALREAAAWLDDPRTLPDIDESAAVAVIRELRYRADLIKSAMKETP